MSPRAKNVQATPWACGEGGANLFHYASSGGEPLRSPGLGEMLLLGPSGGYLPDVRLDERHPNGAMAMEEDAGYLARLVARERPYRCPVCYLRFRGESAAERCCRFDPTAPDAPLPDSLLSAQRPHNDNYLGEDLAVAVRLLTRRGWPVGAISEFLRLPNQNVRGVFFYERVRISREFGLSDSFEWHAWQGKTVGDDCPEPWRSSVSRYEAARAFAVDALERGLSRQEIRQEYRVLSGGTKRSEVLDHWLFILAGPEAP